MNEISGRLGRLFRQFSAWFVTKTIGLRVIVGFLERFFGFGTFLFRGRGRGRISWRGRPLRATTLASWRWLFWLRSRRRIRSGGSSSGPSNSLHGCRVFGWVDDGVLYESARTKTPPRLNDSDKRT